MSRIRGLRYKWGLLLSYSGMQITETQKNQSRDANRPEHNNPHAIIQDVNTLV